MNDGSEKGCRHPFGIVNQTVSVLWIGVEKVHFGKHVVLGNLDLVMLVVHQWIIPQHLLALVLEHHIVHFKVPHVETTSVSVHHQVILVFGLLVD